ncbi:unnamed protein product [Meganyctiphanes norvegica]|uniref:Transmembrane protein n=1 Tax=Meganyctiphanes norvegica TaxID=48144 RepID=A0AAV2SCA3_MEGNR
MPLQILGVLVYTYYQGIFHFQALPYIELGVHTYIFLHICIFCLTSTSTYSFLLSFCFITIIIIIFLFSFLYLLLIIDTIIFLFSFLSLVYIILFITFILIFIFRYIYNFFAIFFFSNIFQFLVITSNLFLCVSFSLKPLNSIFLISGCICLEKCSSHSLQNHLNPCLLSLVFTSKQSCIPTLHQQQNIFGLFSSNYIPVCTVITVFWHFISNSTK